jgi:ribosome maturation factor RimP
MLRDRLMALVQPVIEGLGYELWDLEYAPGRGDGLVRVYIDATAGVTLDDCERVSRAVSGVLDESDPVPGHYTLEVSSPGLERTLRTAGQFARYVGENVYVELAQPLDGRRRYKGPAARGWRRDGRGRGGWTAAGAADRGHTQGAPGAALNIPGLREDEG